jgi:hypothetical protein
MNAEHEHEPHAHSGHDHGLGHIPVPGRGYEAKDASVPGLLKFGGGLIVALVVIQLLMFGFYRVFITERPKSEPVNEPPNIYQQLRTLHEKEQEALGRYGWVDRKAGIVQIPISRAMELLAAKPDRFGKGPKTEVEMNSHAGTPVPASAPSPATPKPPEGTGPKP